MRKLFFVLCCFVPALAFAAIDMSDCEVIGHQKGNLTEKLCNTVESCKTDFADYPEDMKVCLKHAKNKQECRDYVINQNEKIERQNLLYRCPVNEWWLKQKNKEKDRIVHDLVYVNGKTVDQAALINDDKNVYLFHGKTGIEGFVNKRKFCILGPAGKYGMNMAIVDEE